MGRAAIFDGNFQLSCGSYTFPDFDRVLRNRLFECGSNSPEAKRQSQISGPISSEPQDDCNAVLRAVNRCGLRQPSLRSSGISLVRCFQSAISTINRRRRQCSDVLDQIPDVLVGFHVSKGGHTAQTNSILYDPEQLTVRISLYFRRCKVCGTRVHPAASVSWFVTIEAVTRRAFGPKKLIAFFGVRLQIRRCSGDWLSAAPVYKHMDRAGCQIGFQLAGFRRRTHTELRDGECASDHQADHDG